MNGLRFVLLVVTCALAACAVDHGGGSQLSSQSGALTAPAPLDVEVRLPRGVRLADVAVASATTMDIEARATVDGQAATADGSLSVADGARVGPLTAVGDVCIGEGARVEGDVQASGRVRAPRHAKISGKVTEHASSETTEIRWSVPTAASEGDVTLECRQTRNLYPGTYGTLRAPRDAKLYVHTGVYVFDRLRLDDGAEVIVDGAGGPVQIYVRDRIRLDGTIRASDAGIPNLFVGYLGTHSVRLTSSFSGAFVAPAAELVLASCERCERERRESRQKKRSSLGGFFDRLGGHGASDDAEHEFDDERDRDSKRESHGSDDHAGHGRDDREACTRTTGSFIAHELKVEEGAEVGHLGFDWARLLGRPSSRTTAHLCPRSSCPSRPSTSG